MRKLLPIIVLLTLLPIAYAATSPIEEEKDEGGGGGVYSTPRTNVTTNLSSMSETPPLSSQSIGYGYMGAIVLWFFIFFVFVDKTVQKEQYKQKSKYDNLLKLAKQNIIWFVVAVILSYYMLKPINVGGYLAMVTIALGFFTIIIFINNKKQKGMQKDIWR